MTNEDDLTRRYREGGYWDLSMDERDELTDHLMDRDEDYDDEFD